MQLYTALLAGQGGQYTSAFVADRLGDAPHINSRDIEIHIIDLKAEMDRRCDAPASGPTIDFIDESHLWTEGGT